MSHNFKLQLDVDSTSYFSNLAKVTGNVEREKERGDDKPQRCLQTQNLDVVITNSVHLIPLSHNNAPDYTCLL